MRKQILTILLISPFALMSQVYIGGQISPNLSFFNYNNSQPYISTWLGYEEVANDNSQEYAYGFGANVEYNFTDKIAVLTSLNIDMNRSKYSNTTSYRYTFIQIPVQIRYYLTKNKSFNIKAGLYNNLLNHTNVDYSTHPRSGLICPVEDYNYNKNFNSYTYGPMANIGYDISVKERMKIGIDFGGRYSLNNISNIDNITMKSLVMFSQISMRFRVGK